eukprot:SAG11_NODE_5020_length_1689_cov_2.012579_1_plen_83_part_00
MFGGLQRILIRATLAMATSFADNFGLITLACRFVLETNVVASKFHLLSPHCRARRRGGARHAFDPHAAATAAAMATACCVLG